MALDVFLIVHKKSKIIDELKNIDGFEMSGSGFQIEDKVHLDVFKLAIRDSDFLEIENTFSVKAMKEMNRHGSMPVLSYTELELPEDFGSPIANWNMEFLRWLKSKAKEYSESVTAGYLYERGDWPYEEVRYYFNFHHRSDPVESLEVVAWDGDDEPIWSKTAFRYQDGTIKILDE